MSSYTIGEIGVWLLLTAVLAFALGWMSRELMVRSRSADSRIAAPAPAAEAPPVTPGPHPGSALPLPDGSAPSAEHVIKVSRGSKIYHAPASPAYARTTATMWFTSAEAAEAAGFRKPKNG
jgi:hypothetical protein